MFILAATRTPFCEIGGELSSLTAADLGRAAVSSLLLKTGINPVEIAEVIFGCAHPPFDSANIARIIALRSGIPNQVPACTVQRNCASGLEALTTAHQRLAAGQGDLFLVGGTESMSHIPLLFPHEAAGHFADLNRAKSSSQKLSAAASFSLSDFRPKIGLEMVHRDPFTGKTTGETAASLARELGISKNDQGKFAAASRENARTAAADLAGEICPLFIDGKVIQHDSRPNPDQASRPPLTPVSAVSETTDTDNSAHNADGAVAFLIGTEAAAERLNIEPLGRLNSYAYSGCEPSFPNLGPIVAIEKLKQLSGLTPDDADLIEIHEPFAAQVLAIISALKNQGYELPAEKINRRGGSIALGHPTAATSLRLVLTALDQLHETSSRRALVATSIIGGQGAALYLEKT